MFDSDGDGKLDEDEFFYILEFLGLQVSDEVQESMFRRYDNDKSGFIEYNEFKKIWTRVANTKKELLDRGIEIPKFYTNFQLVRMLERAIDREDEFEHRALKEAERWRIWQSNLEAKKKLIRDAEQRARNELADALDAAGQVYVFGKGPYGQFNTQSQNEFSSSSSCYLQEGYDRMQRIWFERVSEFNANANTVGLWGRSPIDTAISDNVIFVISEYGDIYAWGGNNHFWHDIEPDSYWQTV